VKLMLRIRHEQYLKLLELSKRLDMSIEDALNKAIDVHYETIAGLDFLGSDSAGVRLTLKIKHEQYVKLIELSKKLEFDIEEIIKRSIDLYYDVITGLEKQGFEVKELERLKE